jgi:hypothetical protein
VVVTSPVVRASVLVPVVFTTKTEVLTTELNKNLGINNDVLNAGLVKPSGLPPRL